MDNNFSTLKTQDEERNKPRLDKRKVKDRPKNQKGSDTMAKNNQKEPKNIQINENIMRFLVIKKEA